MDEVRGAVDFRNEDNSTFGKLEPVERKRLLVHFCFNFIYINLSFGLISLE